MRRAVCPVPAPLRRAFTVAAEPAKDGLAVHLRHRGRGCGSATLPVAWLRDHDDGNFEPVTFQRKAHIGTEALRGSVGAPSVSYLRQRLVVPIKGAQGADDATVSVPFAALFCSIAGARSEGPATVALLQKWAAAKQRVVASRPSTKKAKDAEVATKAAAPAAPPAAVSKELELWGARGYRALQHADRAHMPEAVAADPSGAAAALRLYDGRTRLLWDRPALEAVAPAGLEHGPYVSDEQFFPPAGTKPKAAARHIAAQRRRLVGTVQRYGFAVLRAQRSIVDGAADFDPARVPAGEDVAVARRCHGVDTLIRKAFGVVRHTHYGGTSTWGDRCIDAAPPEQAAGSAPAHLDTAYLTHAIDLHTDSTYFLEAPKMQGFGCIHRTDKTVGGGNTLCDAVAVAERLRREHPADFELLSRVPVPAYYVKEGQDVMGYRPVLQLLPTGAVAQVTINVYDRTPLHLSPALPTAEALRRFYEAYARFYDMCREERSTVTLDLGLGDFLFFDNHRLLHAREGFSGPRIMCGAYVGLDDYVSTLRHCVY